MKTSKKIIFVCLMAFCANQIHAASVVSTRHTDDSIAVMVINNVRYILHKVETKETLYAISRRYNVDISLLIQLNTLDSVLKEGKVIRVPMRNDPNKNFNFNSPDPLPKKKIETPKPEVSQPIYHTLKKGETLYSLSKQTPNTTVEKIKAWNNITDDKPIKENTPLIIGYTTRTTATTARSKPTPTKPEPSKPDPKPDIKPDIKPELPTTTNEATEQAVCEWNNNGQLNPNRKFALHRTMPNGTIIKLTNPMNNKVVFVKIVGRLRNDDTTADLLVSKSVADLMNIETMRFKVNMAYKKR